MKDLLEIDGEWLPVVDEPSGRMGQDGYGGMGERLEDSFGWPLLLHEQSNAVFERASRPVIKLPVDLSQDHILRLLQQGGGHMGIVRDQADLKTLGILTLEDVLESLLGDVREARHSID